MQKIIFIIEKIIKYRKCPALEVSQKVWPSTYIVVTLVVKLHKKTSRTIITSNWPTTGSLCCLCSCTLEVPRKWSPRWCSTRPGTWSTASGCCLGAGCRGSAEIKFGLCGHPWSMYWSSLTAAQAQMRVEWYLGLPAKVGFVTCKHVTKHVIITCLSHATHMTPYFRPIWAVF